MEPGIPWWGGGGSFAAGKQGHVLRQKGAEQKSTQQSKTVWAFLGRSVGNLHKEVMLP